MDENLEDLKFRFDAALEGIVVRFAARHHGRRDTPAWTWEPDGKVNALNAQPTILVPLTAGRLHVLLGRNGVGKSRLLQSLLHWTDQASGYPSSALLLSLPDQLAHESWIEAIAAARDSDWMKSQNYPEAELLTVGSPPVMTALRMGFDGQTLSDFVPTVGMMADELLAFFGHSSADLHDWKRRRQSRRQTAEIPEREGPTSWSLRLLDAEYLLLGAHSLPSNLTAEAIDAGVLEVAPGGSWFNQPELRDLVVPAIREFLQAATHVELVGSDCARLHAPWPEAGVLRQFLEEANCRTSMYLDDQTWTTSPFPAGLFSASEIGSRPYVASLSIPLYTERILQGMHGLVGGLPFEVVDMSPDVDVRRRLHEVIKGLMGRFLTVSAMKSDQEATFRISGFPELERTMADAVDRIRSCEIGVLDLALKWPATGDWWRSSDALWKSADGDERLLPSVLWQDAISGEWLEIEQASEGQQQVLALFLYLALLQRQRSGNEGSHVVLVGDEFDRNLHPTASTAVLATLADTIRVLRGVTAVVSTHNIASLSQPALRGASRIYARRGPDGFEYRESLDASVEIIADVLGASFLEAQRIKRLHILVEGNHDELIISDLLRDQIPELLDIDIVNARGLYGWSGIFANALRFLDAPVLLVHDKRDAMLEHEWQRCQSTYMTTGRLPTWGTTGLGKMLTDLRFRRGKGQSRKTDGELEKLLWLLKNNVFDRDPAQARRIHIFGLACDDIVDLLPIKSFPKAVGHSSWEAAHEDFDRHSPRRGGEGFKYEFGITDEAVRKAIGMNRDQVHPELGRLVGEVRRLLEHDP